MPQSHDQIRAPVRFFLISAAALVMTACESHRPPEVRTLPLEPVETSPPGIEEETPAVASGRRCLALTPPTDIGPIDEAWGRDGRFETRPEVLARAITSLVEQTIDNLQDRWRELNSLYPDDRADNIIHFRHPEAITAMIPDELCAVSFQRLSFERGMWGPDVDLVIEGGGRHHHVVATILQRPGPRDALKYGRDAEHWDAQDLVTELVSSIVWSEAAVWLEQHPDLLSLRDEPIRWPYLFMKVRTTTASTLCFRVNPAAFISQRPWCWHEGRPIEKASAFGWRPGEDRRDDASDEGAPRSKLGTAAGFVEYGPFNSRLERWAVRLPQGERTLVQKRRLVQKRSAPPLEPPRPFWYPRSRSATKRTKGKRRPVPVPLPLQIPGAQASWQPIGEEPGPDVGLCDQVWVRPVPTKEGSTLAALELSNERDHMMCLRSNDAWKCAEPRPRDHERIFLTNRYDFVYSIPSSAAVDGTLFVAQRITQEEGGSEEGSGARGHVYLEIFHLHSESLVLVGELEIGAVSWFWAPVHPGSPDRRHGRLTVRYLHPHATAGPGAIRLGPMEFESVWTNSRFQSGRKAVVRQELTPRVKVSSNRLPLEDEVFQLPESPSVAPRPQSYDSRIYTPVYVLDGVWRIEPGSGLVR